MRCNDWVAVWVALLFLAAWLLRPQSLFNPIFKERNEVGPTGLEPATF